MPKVKKVPQRTCLGCRAIRPKREMLRIVKTPVGLVELDPTGKKAGRGAYICPTKECLDKILDGRKINHALEISMTPEMREALNKELIVIVV